MRFRTSLSTKIFTTALLILSVLTLVGAFFVSIVDKASALEKAQLEALDLRDQLALSMTEAVWNFAYSQVETMLSVAMRDERIAHIIVWNTDGSVFIGFERLSDNTLTLVEPGAQPKQSTQAEKIVYAELARDSMSIGMLEIGFVFSILVRGINQTLLAFSVRSVVIVLFGLLLLVVYVKVVLIDAIVHLSDAVGRIEHKDFTVRVGKEIRRKDEIGSLARRLNSMVETLQVYSSDMENLVAERTSRLVESEKLAFLGSLTSGVAHEINTPVGVGVTAASHLQELIHRTRNGLESGDLTRSAMNAFFKEAEETASILLLNLQRASNFVTSFKKITADQSNEDLRLVNLRSYIDEVLFSLRPRLKATPHTINVGIPDDITWYGYPGMLSQIVSNLLMNSLAHAYPDKRAGTIELKAHVQNKQVVIEYGDDGVGISAENLSKIFQPFYTTRREQGGTGLGLYIVYNIVSKLGGSIKCVSQPGDGVSFIIILPQQILELNEDK